MKKTNDLASSESKEFHQRKFRLKVKFPKLKTEDPPPQQEKKHFCVICNKQFGSGKAYGGHVRIHSDENSNKGTKTKKMKMKKKSKSCVVKKEKEKETDLIRADVEGKIRCCLCGKEFETMPSLFGHMRGHPDRSWKGVRPPSSPEKFNLSYMDDDDGMSRSMDMSDVTEDIQEAACILMMLNYAYWDVKEKAMESSKSVVRSSSEVKVNKPRDEAKRSLGFDLNQPCDDEHEDHPYSCSN